MLSGHDGIKMRLAKFIVPSYIMRWGGGGEAHSERHSDPPPPYIPPPPSLTRQGQVGATERTKEVWVGGGVGEGGEGLSGVGGGANVPDRRRRNATSTQGDHNKTKQTTEESLTAGHAPSPSPSLHSPLSTNRNINQPGAKTSHRGVGGASM